jgi:hypothetical protein
MRPSIFSRQLNEDFSSARKFLSVSIRVNLWFIFAVEIAQLAQVLVALGCPAEKSADMAAQLDKRARQLAAEKNRPYEEALKHLLTLMKQGWAAPKNL